MGFEPTRLSKLALLRKIILQKSWNNTHNIHTACIHNLYTYLLHLQKTSNLSSILRLIYLLSRTGLAATMSKQQKEKEEEKNP